MPCRDARALRPMLALLAEPPLADPELVYEPKYDGIRAIIEIVPGRGTSTVRIFSRLGNEKSAQFPEIVNALSKFGRTLRRTVILDGEIVALDDRGEPAGFQQLQGRIHLTSVRESETTRQGVAFVAFDLLCEGGRDLCDLPLVERRARLERLLGKGGRESLPLVRLSDMVSANGHALLERARQRGWEGLMVVSGFSRTRGGATESARLRHLCDELQRIEAGRGEGVITLPNEVRMGVTNLKKVFWPKEKITKGELLRYYVTVSPSLLPVVEDRPLVMKRFPNGVTGKAFYQQRAPDIIPDGVRVEPVEGDREVPVRLIGGSLLTLLHMTQLAAISQDPWFSRVGSPHVADHAALDLDPGDGVPFARVLDTARWVRDELEALGVRGFPKTSGADGLHIYIPLEPGTPYEAGMIFCQIIATMVAQKHPTVATVERSVRARGRTVYLDYLQNIEGKTLACAYSARASQYAGASTPLTWKEIDEGVDRRDFTIRSLPARLKDAGDLWAGLRHAKGANPRAVEKYVKG